MPKLNVSFTIEGEYLADCIELCEEFLTVGILNTFDREHNTESGGPDTKVSNLKVEEIKEVTLEQALRAMNSEPINEALDWGWKPSPIKEELDRVLNSFESKDLAEMFVEEVMGDADDISKVFGWVESTYEHEAEDFLEELEEEE